MNQKSSLKENIKTIVRHITSSKHKYGLASVLLFTAVGTSFVAFSSAETGDSAEIFSASCYPSHIASDDPIVFPGQPGAAHPHEFSGAWSTNAFSTAESLNASGTTCDPVEDTAAYWTPVLYMKGQRSEILHTTAYYAPGRKANSSIKAWPQGFRMIADIKNNTYEKSGYPNAGWLCGSEQVKWGYDASLEDIKYHCPGNLQARIIFPECWDGVNLDTVKPDGTPASNPVTGQVYPNDHRSHAVYVPPPPASGDCPNAYPVATPRLDLKVTFKTQGLVDSKANRPVKFTSQSKVKSSTPYDSRESNEGNTSSDFTVAGGGLNGAPINNNYDVNTYHADFYNGWKQERLEYLIDYCIRQEKAKQNIRPCLNPDTTPGGKRNPNYPNATQPGGGVVPPPLNTTINSGAANPTVSTAASTFAFGSNTAGSTFMCKLDDAEYTNCVSPHSYTDLSLGSHTFSVRATAGGVTEDTPATQTWTVVAPNGPPSVQVTFPTEGQSVTGTITAAATAAVPPSITDGTNISKVEFLLDDTVKLVDTTSTYRYTLDTKTIANGSHTITAKAYDTSTPAITSTATVNFTVNNTDITKPTTPTNVVATATNATTVNLSWAASTDTESGIARYNVVRGGIVIAQPTSSNYTDNTVTASTQYTYIIQAVDGVGNVSTNSTSKTVTTPAVADTTAPSTPNNLTASAASANQVNLSWNASTDAGGSGLLGYYVYRNNSSTPLNTAPITSTSYGDATAAPGTTYTYEVASVDGAGNKSLKASTTVTTLPAGDPGTGSPHVQVTAPINAQTVSGTVAVKITAKPPTAGSLISKVEFIVDGQIISTNNNNKTTPYQFNWDSSRVSKGTHAITARVTDRAGLSATSAPVGVTVN